eukprot:c16034_g1_i1 orf=353-661(+)
MKLKTYVLIIFEKICTSLDGDHDYLFGNKDLGMALIALMKWSFCFAILGKQPSPATMKFRMSEDISCLTKPLEGRGRHLRQLLVPCNGEQALSTLQLHCCCW